MAALAQSRNTLKMGSLVIPQLWTLAVKASTKIYNGAIVVVDSSGYAIGASAATGLIVYGRSEGIPGSGLIADNSSGTAGAINVQVQSGVLKFDNSASGDLIAAANVGADCFLVDDHTVALTDGESARSFAGKIMQVDTDGVWVLMHPMLSVAASLNPASVIALPCPDNTKIANGTIATFTPNFAGRIKKLHYVVWTPVTTGAKLSTINAQIAGVATTGGTLSLTSAAMTPIGAEIVSTAFTGANTFTSGQAITLVASATTAFVEGSGAFLIELG